MYSDFHYPSNPALKSHLTSSILSLPLILRIFLSPPIPHIHCIINSPSILSPLPFLTTSRQCKHLLPSIDRRVDLKTDALLRIYASIIFNFKNVDLRDFWVGVVDWHKVVEGTSIVIDHTWSSKTYQCRVLRLAMEIWVSDQLYAMKPLEAASEVLSGVLRLGFEEVGLETANGRLRLGLGLRFRFGSSLLPLPGCLGLCFPSPCELRVQELRM
jgi:hypothetical protein